MNKKDSIIKTASHLFSIQGYDATTTLQIAKEVGITEPAVFYHFKNKSRLFSKIVKDASASFISRIDSLDLSGDSAIDAIVSLIHIHFEIVDQEPDPIRILLRTCPAQMEEPDSECIQVYRKVWIKLKDTAKTIISKGVSSGEFRPVAVEETSNLLVALLSGLMRQQILSMEASESMQNAAIIFCKNALLEVPASGH